MWIEGLNPGEANQEPSNQQEAGLALQACQFPVGHPERKFLSQPAALWLPRGPEEANLGRIE